MIGLKRFTRMNCKLYLGLQHAIFVKWLSFVGVGIISNKRVLRI